MLQSCYQAKMLTTGYSMLEQYKGSVLIILGPTEPFSDSDREKLVQFIQDGGILILIGDNDGTAKTLDFGVCVSGTPIRDPGSYEVNPSFAVLRDLRGEIFSEVDCILTNYPSCLRWGISAELGMPHIEQAAYTTEKAFVDSNLNCERDPWETQGSLAIIGVFSFTKAQGKLVLVADPGIFINDMFQYNLPFIRSLLNWATRRENQGMFFTGRSVLLDLSHSGYEPEGWLKGAWIMDAPQFYLFCALLGGMALIPGLRGREEKLPKPLGRLISNMQRYERHLQSKTRSDFSEPLSVCYRRFLRRCARLLGVEVSAKQVLSELNRRAPQLARRIVRVLAKCELVNQGILRVETEEACALIRHLKTLEREIEEWSRK